jgi:MFS family permease
MHMKARIFFWFITSALAGFLFGFETVAISGAEQTIKVLWRLSDGIHGLAMGAALCGTVLGSLLGGWPIGRFGRRTLLYIGSFGYIMSLGLTAWAFFTQHYSIVPACIFALIAAHAVGRETVIWVLISAILPTRHRAEGQAGQLHALVLCRVADHVRPEDGDVICSGLCVPLLLRHNGSAAYLSDIHGAGHQGDFPERNAA